MLDELNFTVYTTRNLEELRIGDIFAEMLNIFPSLTPDLWGYDEPISTPFKMIDCQDELNKGHFIVLEKKTYPNYNLMIDNACLSSKLPTYRPKFPRLSFITCSFSDISSRFDYNQLRDVLFFLHEKFKGSYSFLTSKGTVVNRIHKYLDDLHWIDIFGQPYLDLIDARSLVRCSAYNKGFLKDTSFFIQCRKIFFFCPFAVR